MDTILYSFLLVPYALSEVGNALPSLVALLLPFFWRSKVAIAAGAVLGLVAYVLIHFWMPIPSLVSPVVLSQVGAAYVFFSILGFLLVRRSAWRRISQ